MNTQSQAFGHKISTLIRYHPLSLSLFLFNVTFQPHFQLECPHHFRRRCLLRFPRKRLQVRSTYSPYLCIKFWRVHFVNVTAVPSRLGIFVSPSYFDSCTRRLPNNWANHVSDGGSHRWVWLGLSRVRSKTNCHVRFFLCDWRGWLCLDMSLWVYLSLASLHLTLLFPEYYWFTLTSSVFQRHPAECPVHRPVLNPLLTQPRERNFG